MNRFIPTLYEPVVTAHTNKPNHHHHWHSVFNLWPCSHRTLSEKHECPSVRRWWQWRGGEMIPPSTAASPLFYTPSLCGSVWQKQSWWMFSVCRSHWCCNAAISSAPGSLEESDCSPPSSPFIFTVGWQKTNAWRRRFSLFLLWSYSVFYFTVVVFFYILVLSLDTSSSVSLSPALSSMWDTSVFQTVYAVCCNKDYNNPITNIPYGIAV